LRKWWFAGGLVVVLAGAAGSGLALASSSAGGATIKTFSKDTVAINKYIQSGDRFAPGTIKVKSGATLTFEYGDREQEPHTLTIVPAAQLPKTLQQVENCRVCQVYGAPHLKNPKAPPDQNNPIVHWTLDKGQPGLDAVGDSLAIQPGAHKSIREIVSAPAGTTLHFICAVHPWMQGQIVVTS
jgi:plastocyanin